jgi:hypothetical protein
MSSNGEDPFFQTLVFGANEQWEEALKAASAFRECSNSALAAQLFTYVSRKVFFTKRSDNQCTNSAALDLYGETEPFDAFVTGGGNVGL